MKPIHFQIGLLLALTMTGACATIDRGTSEPFEVQTSPSGAVVKTDLGKSCAPTPCVIPGVSREADFTVTIEKKGYKTRSYKIMHARSEGVNANLVPNIFLTAGVGAVIDANNGSTQELVPNPLVVTLEPAAGTTRAEQKTREQIIDDALGRTGRN
ncbi:MAG: translation initiation factor 2 [Pseudomonadota bacterium]